MGESASLSSSTGTRGILTSPDSMASSRLKSETHQGNICASLRAEVLMNIGVAEKS